MVTRCATCKGVALARPTFTGGRERGVFACTCVACSRAWECDTLYCPRCGSSDWKDESWGEYEEVDQKCQQCGLVNTAFGLVLPWDGKVVS